MSILDKFGRPLRDVKVRGEHKIIENLPAWCKGALYKSDDDVIVLVVNVPASDYAHAHELQMESTPDELRAVLEALQLCLTRSEQAAAIVDVPSSPKD